MKNFKLFIICIVYSFCIGCSCEIKDASKDITELDAKTASTAVSRIILSIDTEPSKWTTKYSYNTSYRYKHFTHENGIVLINTRYKYGDGEWEDASSLGWYIQKPIQTMLTEDEELLLDDLLIRWDEMITIRAKSNVVDLLKTVESPDYVESDYVDDYENFNYGY
jgi:hypothetical protein